MKHQPRDLKPNLASRSEVLSIYKCPPQKNNNWGPFPQIWGAKHQILDHFSATFAQKC